MFVLLLLLLLFICFDLDLACVSTPLQCDHTSMSSVSAALHLSCDCSAQSGLHDALSPTQMPPKKRHRRSASIPGGTRSESRIHRYFIRHRQSSDLPHPVPVHADIAGIVRPPDVSSLPVVSFGTSDVCQNASGRFVFNFSGSRASHISSPFAELPLSPFRAIQIPSPVRPVSDCRVESVARSSASSLLCMPVIWNEHREAAAGASPLQQTQRVMRCHSQPGALLTRTSSLKRRRDEYRPWLDFRKMREVIIFLYCLCILQVV